MSPATPRHRASTCGWSTTPTVVLTVTDDGRGLAPGSLPSANGIRGMRERAMLVGAALSIGSPPAGGTQVELTSPTRLRAPDDCR